MSSPTLAQSPTHARRPAAQPRQRPIIDRQEVAAVLRVADEYLRRHKPASFGLVTDPEQVQWDAETGCWFVVVRPDSADTGDDDWYSNYADAAMAIEMDYPRFLQLVAHMPDELRDANELVPRHPAEQTA